jgi:hypothetical protein
VEKTCCWEPFYKIKWEKLEEMRGVYKIWWEKMGK